MWRPPLFLVRDVLGDLPGPPGVVVEVDELRADRVSARSVSRRATKPVAFAIALAESLASSRPVPSSTSRRWRRAVVIADPPSHDRGRRGGQEPMGTVEIDRPAREGACRVAPRCASVLSRRPEDGRASWPCPVIQAGREERGARRRLTARLDRAASELNLSGAMPPAVAPARRRISEPAPTVGVRRLGRQLCPNLPGARGLM